MANRGPGSIPGDWQADALDRSIMDLALRLTDDRLSPIDLAVRHPVSLAAGLRNRETFARVRAYCLFVGTRYCGQSLVGALLDAHPEIVMAHELGALKYLTARYGRLQLFQLILWNARRFGRAGRTWNGYSYRVPGQWQGRHRSIAVIGDKQGSGATLRLRARPGLLERLRHTVGCPIRVLHVYRNPYDVIGTWSARNGIDLTEAARHHDRHVSTIALIREALAPDEFMEMRHEDFVTDARASLELIHRFLGVESDPAHLDACAGIVFPSPRRTRDRVPWPSERIEAVRSVIEARPWLRGYDFEGD